MDTTWYLDGSDWEVDYFLPEADRAANAADGRIADMLVDSAQSAGFIRRGEKQPGAMRGTVPGCDRSVLLENGLIADPYFGRNLEHSRWAERYSWAFRKRFRLPSRLRGRRRLRLTFQGIDYAASFFLNDEWLGRHEGMFTPAVFDVSAEVDREGENLLAVVFDPAPKASPDHRRDRPADFAAFHRCQMSHGWDWARPLVPTGIWDRVRLEGSDAVRIDDVFFRCDGEEAVVEISLDALDPVACPVEILLEPDGFDGPSTRHRAHLELSTGANVHRLRFAVAGIRRWYPNGYGGQPLYRLRVDAGGERRTLRVGCRQLAMARNPGSPEGAYDQTFVVNGRPVFARGVNWVPMDLVFSRMGPEDYERQVRLAAAGGFNLFRVWGGGLVEKEAFYDACDRHGILVWQEFAHACSAYPSDGGYLAFKRREADAILRKLRNHVSLSLLCGGNEVQYFGESPDNPLYALYRERAAELAPGIAYHLSSPDLSRPGERHHGPWNFREHAVQNDHRKLVASEVGCNGPPEEESVLRFVPDADPWPRGRHWRYHFLVDTETRSMKPQLEAFAPRSRREFCQAAMFAQADVNGYWMEHYRRLAPEASGCFIWQYNESWPTCAYSIVDHYTLPKIAYYRLAKANAPLGLSLRDESWRCRDGRFAAELFLVNDTGAPVTGRVELRGSDAAGRGLFSWTGEGEYAEGVHRLAGMAEALPEDVCGGVVLVRMRITRGDAVLFEAERCYGAPDFTRVFRLPPATLEASATVSPAGGGEKRLVVEVANHGPVAALGVRLHDAGLDCRHLYWEDNYVAVEPGGLRRVAARLVGAARPGRLTCRAWNAPETAVAIVGAAVTRRPGDDGAPALVLPGALP